jgi:hypothetical protein
VEIAVVMEEGVVLRRGSLVLYPFGGEEYCGVDDPFGLDLHQQFRRGSLVLCPFRGEEYCGVDDPFGIDLHRFHNLPVAVSASQPSLSCPEIALYKITRMVISYVC